MLAGKLNLKIQQHSTFRKKFTWKDGRGRPVNLTGWSAKLQMRTAPGETVLLEMSSPSNGITVGANGVINLYLTDEQTGAIQWSSASYDLVLANPDGEEWRLVEGRVTVSPSITRPTE